MKRFIGYCAGAIAASLFYVTWVLVGFASLAPTEGNSSFRFELGFALFYWLSDGFCATLGLMALLWIAAVRVYPLLRLSGPVYYGGIGAFLTLIIGSAMASLSPKPCFIEDQTFFEGFLISVQRQGICLFLAGLIFGLIYWFLSERHRAPQG